ncbi:PepSY domain-containing protein [Dyella sp. C9]|uniref:PepSY domain-containing protein n=1 Tax=Dyella sp. C9 TaxID=2202154 RepID=UPI000DEF59F0|nr:PepSY domain-containing protein [Dyella sp. C9]
MKTITSLALAAALGFAWAASAQDALTQHQVQASLEQQGYRKVHDLAFHGGVWTAKAPSANGQNVDVRAQLSTEGYTRVHDVDFKDGVWTARADNPAGKGVALQLAPDTGRAIGADRH